MNDQEIEDLVTRWHRVASKEAGDLSLQGAAIQLLQTINASPGLRELASTPLLASAICALNLNASGGLPAQRRQLYEGLVHMMVEKRDQDRGLDPVEGTGLTLNQKVVLLASVAARAVEDGDVTIHREEFMAVLKSRLAMANRDVSADKVSLFLLERTGLLRQVDQDHYEFIHRTFQEFLASLHFVQERKYDQAVALIGNRGSELSYFMATLAPDAGPIIKAIMAELWSSKANPYIAREEVLLSLARCVEDSVQINLEDGYEIASLYNNLVKFWERDTRIRKRSLIETKLAKKIPLGD